MKLMIIRAEVPETLRVEDIVDSNGNAKTLCFPNGFSFHFEKLPPLTPENAVGGLTTRGVIN